MHALEETILALAKERPSLREACIRERDLGPLVAEALVSLSGKYHPEEDRTERLTAQPTRLETEEAGVLWRRYGSLRSAAHATGLSKDTFYRALRRRKAGK